MQLKLSHGPKWSSRVLASLVGLVLLLSVAGCQDASDSGLTVEDAYVKAMPAGEMTAIFATLRNSTSEDITLVSAESAAAESTELHEMVMEDGSMVMRERPEGITVPAGEEVRLEPGGLHVMLIGLTADVEPGAEVTATLNTEDGEQIQITAVARDMANAQESYQP